MSVSDSLDQGSSSLWFLRIPPRNELQLSAEVTYLMVYLFRLLPCDSFLPPTSPSQAHLSSKPFLKEPKLTTHRREFKLNTEDHGQPWKGFSTSGGTGSHLRGPSDYGLTLTSPRLN